jgi:hypothetical protein
MPRIYKISEESRKSRNVTIPMSVSFHEKCRAYALREGLALTEALRRIIDAVVSKPNG